MIEKHISKSQFCKALGMIKAPGKAQKKFLQAHYSSPGKASTASVLARAAKYKSYDGINLQYGLLAKRIGEALGIPDAHLGLILEFNRPDSLTNEHWVLSMKSEFADALLEQGWVDRA